MLENSQPSWPPSGQLIKNIGLLCSQKRKCWVLLRA